MGCLFLAGHNTQWWKGSTGVRVVGELFEEGDLNALDLMTQLHGRTELQLQMLLNGRQRQQHQRLAVDLLHASQSQRGSQRTDTPTDR